MQDRFETVATDYKNFFDLITKISNFSFPYTRSVNGSFKGGVFLNLIDNLC